MASAGRSRLPPALIRCAGDLGEVGVVGHDRRRGARPRPGRARRPCPASASSGDGTATAGHATLATVAGDSRGPEAVVVGAEQRWPVDCADRTAQARGRCSNVRTLHRPSPPSRRPRPGRSAAPQPQLHRHRAHPARADPRGRGGRGQGARVARHLARGRPQPGRGDHRPGWQQSPCGPHPVHAAGQEGARAVAPRGAAARPQLHRHRAHPPRPHPRGRGRRRPGAREAGRRPEPRAPAGHPAAVGLLRLAGRGRGRGGKAGQAAGSQTGESPSRLARARPVRSQPHAAGAREEARPGHRSRTARSSA